MSRVSSNGIPRSLPTVLHIGGFPGSLQGISATYAVRLNLALRYPYRSSRIVGAGETHLSCGSSADFPQLVLLTCHRLRKFQLNARYVADHFNHGAYPHYLLAAHRARSSTGRALVAAAPPAHTQTTSRRTAVPCGPRSGTRPGRST